MVRLSRQPWPWSRDISDELQGVEVRAEVSMPDGTSSTMYFTLSGDEVLDSHTGAILGHSVVAATYQLADLRRAELAGLQVVGTA